jgi:hypothetical protein
MWNSKMRAHHGRRANSRTYVLISAMASAKGKSHMNANSIEDRKRWLKKFMPDAKATNFQISV